MAIPKPTPIYRLVHVDNLKPALARDTLLSPNHWPKGAPPYRTIHNASVQASRSAKTVPVGVGGNIHDYLPFYFGVLSVMLLNLKTGRVAGYSEGQTPLIYLKTTVAAVVADGCDFAFTDGHGLAAMTRWFDDTKDLSQVDWSLVNARYWADRPDDNDRQRRKQAEFLVHRECVWPLIDEIGVIDSAMKTKVETILAGQKGCSCPPVNVHRDWYYY